MQYYVCNNPEPMDVPWGTSPKFYVSENAAVAAAAERAADDPNETFYVHVFELSRVIFKASSSIKVESEYL